MYRTLKCQTRSNQSRDLKIDIDELNKFSTFIGPELSRQVPEPHHAIDPPCFDKTMNFNYTSPEELALIIKKKKNRKSSGCDGISNEILKCCSPVVEEHLSKAFNGCPKIGLRSCSKRNNRLYT